MRLDKCWLQLGGCQAWSWSETSGLSSDLSRILRRQKLWLSLQLTLVQQLILVDLSKQTLACGLLHSRMDALFIGHHLLCYWLFVRHAWQGT